MDTMFITLISQIQPGLPEAITAWQAGEFGISVGIIGLIVIATLRNLRIDSIVDGTVGLVFGIAATSLFSIFQILADGGEWYPAILAGVSAAVVSLGGAAVTTRNEKIMTP